MLKKISKINGVQKLNSKEQKEVKGGNGFNQCGRYQYAICNPNSNNGPCTICVN